jgi:hypothetical protein
LGFADATLHGVTRPEHPMLPFLVDLELTYDANAHRDYEPSELVRFALTCTDYWADLAMAWLERGVPVAGLKQELVAFESQHSRPQRLRHRARRLLRTAGESH